LPNLAVEAGVVATSDVRLTPLPDACPRKVVLAWRPNSARRTVFRALAGLLRETRAAQARAGSAHA
jgi:LysR family hydrogen peroxide-inducible transcriptional activator